MKFSIGSFRLKLDGAMQAASHALPAQIQAAPYATLPARSLRLNAGQAPPQSYSLFLHRHPPFPERGDAATRCSKQKPTIVRNFTQTTQKSRNSWNSGESPCPPPPPGVTIAELIPPL